MKIKSLVAILLLSLGITACSTVKKVVYRIDVPQGNYLEKEKVEQLQIGMNQEQVIYLLGTPVLRNTFESDRWDYVFIKRHGHEEPIQHTLFVHFDKQGLVSKIDLDKPIESKE
ncbi:Beta-barrel assembly machine subunit BamE [Nicoletella semolina]|uniref:Outer membrane protein assembly factor BamE n=1 Tax=Nicoletella semolina TaxID=271160 RepID=A0A4V2SJH1_9PAST|nr:outer membrane protein assembly factor BamE [Nicoletella semolina]MDH2925232.1 membrane biogenesis protein [Nicoletella semolina]TCP15304.1 Beta-barrel assembly machine subunit BamE [Nicoletella semolina]